MSCFAGKAGEDPWNRNFKVCEANQVGDRCQVGEVAMLIARDEEGMVPPGSTVYDIPAAARPAENIAKYMCVDERKYFSAPALKDICDRTLPSCDAIPPGPAMCIGDDGVPQTPTTCGEGMIDIWEFQDWRSPSQNYREKGIRMCAREEDIQVACGKKVACEPGQRAMFIPTYAVTQDALRELGIENNDLKNFSYAWPSISMNMNATIVCVSDAKYEDAAPYEPSSR